MSTSHPASVGPVSTPERIHELDGLRGLALLGVFVANLATFSFWFTLPPEARAALPTAVVDGPVWWAMHVLVEGKFYTLFSLLFGIGFAVQMGRAEARGDAFLSRFRRRLVALLGIGLVHLTLIWGGDILTLYALCGFALLLFRTRSDRALLVWAVVLIALPVAQYAAMWALFSPDHPMAMAYANPGILLTPLVPSAAAALGVDWPAAFLEGGWWDVVKGNLVSPIYRFGDLAWTGRFFKVLGVFVLGLWTGRHLMRGTLLGDTRLLRRVAAWGLAVGLPANVALAVLMDGPGTSPPGPSGLAQVTVYALGVVPLALAYAAGFALLWRRSAWRRVLGVAAPAGRMALTNYLTQSLLGIGLFYGIGLGLAHRVGPAVWTALGLVLFAGQIAASTWWLARFRYGPAEWLWRRLTYARPLSMRAHPVSAPARPPAAETPADTLA